MKKVRVVARAVLEVCVDIEYDETLGTQAQVLEIQNHVNTALFLSGNVRQFEIKSVDVIQ